MHPRWQLRDAMATVAFVAIYLAALHSLMLGPSGDSFAVWQKLVSIVLLFLIMPFHVMAAWARLTARRQE